MLDEEHETIRHVIRVRRQAKDELVSAKLALRSFLLQHERRFPGRPTWNKAYWRWLDPVLSEQSSGARVRRSAITKTDNGQARRMLLETRWCYRFPARENSVSGPGCKGNRTGDQEHRTVRAGPPVRAVPQVRADRQAAAKGDRGGRARARWVHMGQ